MKACSKCGAEKPLAEFAKSGRKGLRSCCKQCWAAYIREYSKRPQARSKIKEASRVYYRANAQKWRDAQLRKRFGLSLVEYEAMLAAQDGKCAGCGRPGDELTKALNVDHCHASGRIRGLLCPNCNHALGHVGDDPTVLASLARYLEDSMAGERFVPGVARRLAHESKRR